MQPTLIETERRKRGRPPVGIGQGAVTPKTKARVLWMLEQGATLTEIARTKGLPSLHAIHNERKRDVQFDNDIRAARIVGAEVKLDLCAEHAEHEATSRDPDRMRVAQMLSAVTTVYVEKIAPREFGQLVKLGGDPNAPLAVQVINYSTLNGGALTPVDNGNSETDAREVAAQVCYDAETATSGKAISKRAIRADRSSPGRRRMVRDDRQKAKAKAPRKAS